MRPACASTTTSSARTCSPGTIPSPSTIARACDRYFATVFHREDAKPWLPWPASTRPTSRDARAMPRSNNRCSTAIGRGPERFLPGSEAARIQQPALLLWCRQDAVIDPSALALYAARIPQATGVLLDDCGHMSIMERPEDVAVAIDPTHRTRPAPMNARIGSTLAVALLLAACGPKDDPQAAAKAAAARSGARRATRGGQGKRIRGCVRAQRLETRARLRRFAADGLPEFRRGQAHPTEARCRARAHSVPKRTRVASQRCGPTRRNRRRAARRFPLRSIRRRKSTPAAASAPCA